MAAIMALFQLVWVYYELVPPLPAIAGNVNAVLLNIMPALIYRRLSRRERDRGGAAETAFRV